MQQQEHKFLLLPGVHATEKDGSVSGAPGRGAEREKALV